MAYIPIGKKRTAWVAPTKQKQNNNMSFYNSKAWRQLRARYIKQNPLCVMCKAKGIIEPAKHIDHIVPISKGGEGLNENNLQSLCIKCHSRKTIKE